MKKLSPKKLSFPPYSLPLFSFDYFLYFSFLTIRTGGGKEGRRGPGCGRSLPPPPPPPPPLPLKNRASDLSITVVVVVYPSPFLRLPLLLLPQKKERTRMDGKFFFISHITPHISSPKEFFSEGGRERWRKEEIWRRKRKKKEIDHQRQ